MKDLSKYLGNNKKRITSAVVINITPELLKQCDVKDGEKVVLGYLPADAIITGAYKVVNTALTGMTVTFNVNGIDAVPFDVASVGVASISQVVLGKVTKKEIIATFTKIGTAATGSASLVIPFFELDAYSGTFTA